MIERLILERKSAQARAADAKPLPAHRRPTKAEQVSKGIVNTFTDGRGAGYQAARIARDNPEIHEAMKRGEYASVRAAARVANEQPPATTTGGCCCARFLTRSRQCLPV